MTVRQRSSAAGTKSRSDPIQPQSDSSLTDRPSESRETNSYLHNFLLANLFRFLGKIGFWWHTWCLSPRGARVTRSEKIRVRDGHEITLRIYDPSPSSYSTTTSAGASSKTSAGASARPCVINFHGGGWTIGSATDDARWARWVIDAGYTFISVEYRLAPEYPWPTGARDCIDVTRYIINHAGAYGIDKDKLVLSGFSAGGNLAVTTALALAHPHILDPSSASASPAPEASAYASASTSPIHLLGVIPFYPVLDLATPRSIKLSRARRPEILRTLPGWMTRMFDSSYLPVSSSSSDSVKGDGEIDRRHTLISPGLAPEDLLANFPNTHLCLCEADVLAPEGQAFADRLKTLEGRKGEVVSRWVSGARHGWDKPPHFVVQSVRDEYDAAVQSITRWCMTER